MKRKYHIHAIIILISRPEFTAVCLPKNASSDNLTSYDDNKKLNVTNARPPKKLPPSPKSPPKSPVNEFRNDDRRSRSNTTGAKSVNKPRGVASMYNHQDLIINELAKKMNITVSDEKQMPSPDQENLYENCPKTRPKTPSNDSYDRKRSSTLEKVMIMNDAFESKDSSLKKRPKPLPKPAGSSSSIEDHEQAEYVNQDCLKATTYSKEDIYQNVSRNLPDDAKVKSKSMDLLDAPPGDSYVIMGSFKSLARQRSTINFDGSSCDNLDIYDTSYVTMNGKTHHKRKSNPDYVSMNRLKSDSVHVRGDVGCLYGSLDYMYIYELNPKSIRGNEHPFIKKKEKATPMPCYCHEDLNKDVKMLQKNKCKQKSGSQLVYYSCEDIYGTYNGCKNGSTVKKENEEDQYETFPDRRGLTASYQGQLDSIEPRHSGSLLKKKYTQVKQLISDW